MAWAIVTGGGATGDKTAGSTWAANTGSMGVYPNDDVYMILVLATDNRTTTDGNTNDHQSATIDVAGITVTKLREFTNGQGTAANGACVSIWLAGPYRVTQNTSFVYGTITFTFSGSITAKGMGFQLVTLTRGSGWTLDAQAADVANDAADAGSLTVTPSYGEHLFIRGGCSERAASVGNITVTSGWSQIGGGTSAGTSGGSSVTNVSEDAECRVQTTSSATSDPTTAAVDQASTLVVVNEIVPGFGPRAPFAPI